MKVEIWKSNKGKEEIHHFIEGTQTYLFGFNKKVLGTKLYKQVLNLVKKQPAANPTKTLLKDLNKWRPSLQQVDPFEDGR